MLQQPFLNLEIKIGLHVLIYKKSQIVRFLEDALDQSYARSIYKPLPCILLGPEKISQNYQTDLLVIADSHFSGLFDLNIDLIPKFILQSSNEELEIRHLMSLLIPLTQTIRKRKDFTAKDTREHKVF